MVWRDLLFHEPQPTPTALRPSSGAACHGTLRSLTEAEANALSGPLLQCVCAPVSLAPSPRPCTVPQVLCVPQARPRREPAACPLGPSPHALPLPRRCCHNTHTCTCPQHGRRCALHRLHPPPLLLLWHCCRWGALPSGPAPVPLSPCCICYDGWPHSGPNPPTYTTNSCLTPNTLTHPYLSPAPSQPISPQRLHAGRRSTLTHARRFCRSADMPTQHISISTQFHAVSSRFTRTSTHPPALSCSPVGYLALPTLTRPYPLCRSPLPHRTHPSTLSCSPVGMCGAMRLRHATALRRTSSDPDCINRSSGGTTSDDRCGAAAPPAAVAATRASTWRGKSSSSCVRHTGGQSGSAGTASIRETVCGKQHTGW